MSWQATSAVLRSPRRFGPSARLVLLALADFADKNGCKIFPSVGTLARLTELSPRRVKAHRRALQAAGVLILVRKARGHHPSEFRIDVGALCEPDSVVTKLAHGLTNGDRGDAGDTPEVTQVTPQRCQKQHPRGVAGDTESSIESSIEPAAVAFRSAPPTAPRTATKLETREEIEQQIAGCRQVLADLDPSSKVSAELRALGLANISSLQEKLGPFAEDAE